MATIVGPSRATLEASDEKNESDLESDFYAVLARQIFAIQVMKTQNGYKLYMKEHTLVILYCINIQLLI